MKLSTDRILTSHVGSLPRSQEVVDFLFAQDRGEAYDQAAFDAAMQRGVDFVVAQQAANGVDVRVDSRDGLVPTPALSLAILRHNAGGGRGT